MVRSCHRSPRAVRRDTGRLLYWVCWPVWKAGCGPNELQVLAALLLAGTAALIVAAYMAASRAEVDGTTEMAALVVLAAGVVAGLHELRLASATIAVTTLLLVEKSRLHKIVERIDDASLRAGLRFAVMAVVILPILPAGPYGPLGGIRPRQLWAMVLFFSGLSFAGYIARRWMGSKRGYPIAGLLGGSFRPPTSHCRLHALAGAKQMPGCPWRQA